MSDTGYLHSDPSNRRKQLCGTLRAEGPQGQKQQSWRPGDGMGWAELKNGVGVGLVSKGRIVDGTLSGKAGPCRPLQDSPLSSKGQGKPLQRVRQRSDMIRCAFFEDHSGCTVENGTSVGETPELAFKARYQLGPTYLQPQVALRLHTPVLLVNSASCCLLHAVLFCSFNSVAALLSSGNALPAVFSGLTPGITHSACSDVGPEPEHSQGDD